MKPNHSLVAMATWLCLSAVLIGCKEQTQTPAVGYFKVSGQELLGPDGNPYLIRGTNLGNWLNPEGYMFRFGGEAASYFTINEAFCQMVGPDYTARFWREMQTNYVTHDDIRYLRSTGINSLRLPFHYKLFTDEDYMGYNARNPGFERIDSVISWCKAEGLYVILDMHDAPGGQTGDNIDDSFGYPWLFVSEESQQLFCDIWEQIAQRYANEPTIMAYDLLNEPIATYFAERDSINQFLEPLYLRATKAIRKHDRNHVIMYGGAQWNSNFSMFTQFDADPNTMYTCHRYWCDTLQVNVQDFVDFRTKSGRPTYMGETGENSDTWVGAYRRLLEKNNIGWHFWPYKRMGNGSSFLNVVAPENWDQIVAFTRAPRGKLSDVRANRPDQAMARKALNDLLENMKLSNCKKNTGYIEALGLRP